MTGAKSLVFMGTPDFGVPILYRLVRDGYNISAVVTQPDRPAGRGRQLAPPPVKVAALKLGLPVYQPDRARDPEFIVQLRNLSPTAIIVAAFGQILPRAILEIPAMGAINVHASLLPDLRGASPIAEAIARGYRRTGVTIMLMDEGLDTGPVLAQRPVDIEPEDTAESLSQRLSEVGAELLSETLPRWFAGEIQPVPQDHSAATYTKPLTKESGRVDWNLPAEKIERLCRAYYPWPGCYTRWDDKIVKLLKVKAVSQWAGRDEPGRVVLLSEGDKGRQQLPAVATGAGVLIIESLQLEGRKPLSGAEFLRGSRGFIGAKLA